MLKVFGRRNSANVQKVMWLVGELGVEHQHIPLGGSFGGLDTLEFRAMNPNGKVPVIADDGVVVWESHAILRYLAAEYGKDRFWSASPAARARVESWMDWAQTALQPAFLNGVFWGMYRTPEPQRNWTTINESLGHTTRALRLLDAALAHKPYLAGDALTLADVPAGTMLYRYFTMEIERPSIPNVEAWYERLTAHSAYREHVMVPYNDLRGRLAY